MLAALREYQPDFLRGYSRTLCHVAEAANAQDRKAIRPRAVAPGGEVLTEPIRRQIAEVFRAPVYDSYGSHELNLIAWECKETGELHTCDDSVIVEVLKDGRPAAPGEQGELVGTHLHSLAMPFIRFRLGDTVTVGRELCRCGAPFSTLTSVDGRQLPYLYGFDGRAIHPYSITQLIVNNAPWVLRFQIFQDAQGVIFVRIVPAVEPSRQELLSFEKALGERLGSNVEFRLVLVKQLEMGAGGKFLLCRSLFKKGAAGPGKLHALSADPAQQAQQQEP
jgi:phenylacetate-CoA ligase